MLHDTLNKHPVSSIACINIHTIHIVWATRTVAKCHTEEATLSDRMRALIKFVAVAVVDGLVMAVVANGGDVSQCWWRLATGAVRVVERAHSDPTRRQWVIMPNWITIYAAGLGGRHLRVAPLFRRMFGRRVLCARCYVMHENRTAFAECTQDRKPRAQHALHEHSHT